MPAPKLTKRLFWAAEILLLAGTVAAAAGSRAQRNGIRSLLVALLLVLALVGEWFSVETATGS